MSLGTVPFSEVLSKGLSVKSDQERDVQGQSYLGLPVWIRFGQSLGFVKAAQDHTATRVGGETILPCFRTMSPTLQREPTLRVCVSSSLDEYGKLS